jgi:hemerythrin
MAGTKKWEALHVKDLGGEDMIITGYRSLDDEHHMQIELLEAFRRAAMLPPDRHAVDEILDRLIDYTKIHFTSEQLLMRLYQYPGYQDHMDDHDQTIERIQALREAYLDGNQGLTLQTADALAEGLRTHIRTADRALGRFLVRLGVGPG